ncbi:MAG: SPOR domain-containing protein [Ignavibacteriota bacterium]|nr:MAG: SPOR domain-containing protein [Chlorobiota bacterium]MBE7478250.1 SPOR domain-containing protein [Ignavibacteriales bacterium]MBL1121520.1 SPOR domain-containing protein [Ignavibacteriota bacterium]MCC7094086.1 SPOR domain-containing protein [Ignavibacteriaceae bacterium]MCE7855756.1 SPOR domain-containing protein [Ignavibacteria bacterium CHB3]MEB2295417.1 SPOR domain-containing protein [Ignavibacteria bacterium]
MISKDDLVKVVAQKCGVSVESSSFFFEVFVNRLSNKLKPGDLLHFYDLGFFHKRNCRIQLEKSPDSPIPKSYLIQLVIFSDEAKIKSDLSSIHFLKIANLKTLWVDDKDFQKSLAAGDFAPHTERNQLIKSFATKAEVIIAGLRKDFDNELVEELIIPLTFDLNFLIKTGQKNKSTSKSSASKIAETKSDPKPVESKESIVPKKDFEETKTVIQKDANENPEKALPWNYGAKFLDKEKQLQPGSKNIEGIESEKKGIQVNKNNSHDKVNEFEPVSSHLSTTKSDEEEIDTVKYIVSTISESVEDKEDKKFTEVKSKTDSFRYQADNYRDKKGGNDKFPFRKTKNNRDSIYRERKSFLPIVSIMALVVIGAIVIYLYVIKEKPGRIEHTNIVQDIQPPPTGNVIERDYEYAVTYPYPKSDEKVDISGYDQNLFSESKNESVINEKNKSESITETTTELKTENKSDKNKEAENKTTTEIKTPPPVEQKENTVAEPKVEKSNRIFLYKNFYVVYVASYNSEEDVNRAADRYFELGYNAIVETVERGRNPEYKLIVGDFTSEEFAKQFQQKYIK